ncbi:MAG: FecR domain-containing protein [Candidatus Azambacteria bacterium]|nr:FecR domain-containing protein [Candidatus Azambacteria bacterium]
MKKIIIAIVILIILAVVGFALAGKFSRNEEKLTVLPAADSLKVWVEVLTPKAFELDAKNGNQIRELQTGDELSAGAMIETSKEGFINLYFPDGSILRVSENTKFVLENSYFDISSGKLNVKISLLLGKVWSKILSLATLDSSWEVETSNAVATVRGTAFGMEYVSGQSSVIGSENKVEVAVLDPETKRAIKDAMVTIEPDKQVSIAKEDVEKIKAGKKLLMAIAITVEVKKEDWIVKAKAADEKINQKIEQLKENRLEMPEIKKELRQEIRETIKEKIKERINILEPKKNIIETQVEKQIDTKLPAPQPIQKQAITPITSGVNSIAIVPDRALGEITEEEVVNFKAMMISNGIKRDVTTEVEWKVVGFIGDINNQGVFTAKLAPDVAEYGEVPGTVAAIWKDTKTNEVLLGKSAIFKVKAKVIPDENTAG